MNEMHYWSAVETRQRFLAREVSPVEVLDAVLARTAEVNGVVNALTEEVVDGARAHARRSEERYRVGAPSGPLDGLLVAAKEEHAIAGHSSTAGSLLLTDEPMSESHPVIERVVRAGGIVHARTTTPEFSLAPFTHTKRWGVTRNPWNADFAPGGSSGGAGAALAAGLTTLATGSDIGGSIRLPASFCGVVGFKPPAGRVPGRPPFNQDAYCADGPLGRTVSDVALLQNVIAGPDPRDHFSVRPKYVLPEGLGEVKGLKVALCMTLGDYAVDSSIVENTRSAAVHLEKAGAIVEEVVLPWTVEHIVSIGMAHLGGLAAEEIREVAKGREELLMPYTREFLAKAALSTQRYTLTELLAAEAELYRPVGALLEDFDALLCPTTTTQGILAGDDMIGDASGEEPFTPWQEQIMTLPFNVLSRVPVLTLPSGMAPNGVPTGVQIVGRTYDDVTPFHLGAALEASQDLWSSGRWSPAM